MMTTTHPLAEEYVRRLDHAARALPRHDREELLAEIRTHLDSGLSADASEADVRNLLEDLGPPENIVAAAAGPQPPTPKRGAREVFALILLVTGIPPIFGWLVGVGLLLWSPLWSARQKLLGILVWPRGYFISLIVFGTVSSAQGCPGPVGGPPAGDCVASGLSAWWIIAAIIIAVAPILVATYLYRAAGRHADAA